MVLKQNVYVKKLFEPKNQIGELFCLFFESAVSGHEIMAGDTKI